MKDCLNLQTETSQCSQATQRQDLVAAPRALKTGALIHRLAPATRLLARVAYSPFNRWVSSAVVEERQSFSIVERITTVNVDSEVLLSLESERPEKQVQG